MKCGNGVCAKLPATIINLPLQINFNILNFKSKTIILCRNAKNGANAVCPALQAIISFVSIVVYMSLYDC